MKRIHYIDWLRNLTVLLLIPFHTARIFDIWEPFYAKNPQTSAALSYGIIHLINPWFMPLLFLLAGASTWFALGFRSSGQYALERVKRLLVPLLFGMLVIVPPQAYLARFQGPGYGQPYLEFLLDYFQIRGDLSGYTGDFTPGHLWFILYLLIVSLVALPLLLYLRSLGGKRALGALAHFCLRPGMLLLGVVPLFLAGPLPAPGGKNPFYFLVLFIYGFLMMADERLQEAIDRQKGFALGLALVTSAAHFGLSLSAFHPAKMSAGDILSYLMYTLETLAWLIALLGYGRRFLDFDHRALRYANEMSYPFYILHQTVIIAIGTFVVAWAAPVAVKFVVICASSLAGTVAIYDLAVRRTNVTHWLFGMRPLPRSGRSEAGSGTHDSGVGALKGAQ